MKYTFWKVAWTLVIGVVVMEEPALYAQTHAEEEYFKERIVRAHLENSLIPFDKAKKLSSRKVEQAKKEVWNNWVQTVQQIDTLPPLVSYKQEEPTLHSWDMIDEDPMPFYWIEKVDDQVEEKRALFLNLHGSGPKDQELMATLQWSKVYQDKPSVYFIPQIPNEKRYRWWFKAEQYAWEKLFRLAMVHPKIDVNKIYVMGISEGGYGSQRLGAFYGDYLAGAGPMAGGEPLENAPASNYKYVPLSLQTGELDGGFGRNTLTLRAKHVFDSLANSSNDEEYVHNIALQKGKGHGVDYKVTTPWLINFQRTTRPEHITWVNFPMDGRYRKAFYNITILNSLEVSPDDTMDRVVFDLRFDKSDSSVYLSALKTDAHLQDFKELSKGTIALFLDDEYLDLSKKIKVYYKDKLVYKGKPRLDLQNIVESCAVFGDPNRLFPAKVIVDL